MPRDPDSVGLGRAQESAFLTNTPNLSFLLLELEKVLS